MGLYHRDDNMQLSYTLTVPDLLDLNFRPMHLWLQCPLPFLRFPATFLSHYTAKQFLYM